MKVEWRSVTTTYGALCAMTFLEGLIVLLSVDNLDLVMLVYTSISCGHMINVMMHILHRS